MTNPVSMDFLPQPGALRRLLAAGQAALGYLPEPERVELEQALRKFEQVGARTLWGVGDVEASCEEDDLVLTEGERRRALARFLRNSDASSAEWDALAACARAEHFERIAHVKVEYDLAFTGGEYRSGSQFALIPEALIEKYAKLSPGDELGLAFTCFTGYDARHIVSHSPDERYNEAGERIDAL